MIKLDEGLLMGEGQQLIRKFLLTLQTYKSAGCVERVTEFYERYSRVDDFFLKIRSIVLRDTLPRRIQLNNNLRRYNEHSIEVLSYPSSFEGIILSFADRYNCNNQMVEDILKTWEEHKEDIRVRI